MRHLLPVRALRTVFVLLAVVASPATYVSAQTVTAVYVNASASTTVVGAGLSALTIPAGQMAVVGSNFGSLSRTTANSPTSNSGLFLNDAK